MNYENIKSLVLTILVMLSLLMYYLLWTDQGNTTELPTDNIVEPEKIGSKKEVADIVRPDRIFQHVDGETYGTISMDEINSVLEVLKTVEYGSLENISEEINDIPSFIKQETDSMEIRFPGQTPFSLYRDILHIEESNLFNFDTILVSYNLVNEDEGTVYFISEKENKVYKSNIFVSYINNIKDLQKNITAEETPYNAYFSYQAGSKLIYLPTEETEINRYIYKSETVDSSRLKNAIFTNSSLAQKSVETNQEVYTDDTSILRVIKDTHVVNFKSTSGITVNELSPNQIIENSIDFVNSHGGWVNSFLYVGNDNDQSTINFRIYNETGFPVFNLKNGLSSIKVSWENNKIEQFITSNLTITAKPIDTTTQKLDSGSSVLKEIKSSENFDPDKLEAIVPGYDMVITNPSYVYLEPSWFYLYNGQWRQLGEVKTGGTKSGLE
ncbi:MULTISPECIES: two-component system activity regulator YycH [unclassified Niallia]|uniref:YycH family regulatory protein n=1 Tax=unclassified Niallia TaxID=2837522 RepID=UPI001EDA34FD|nr:MULTISPECIES: two-component system activity regulator YycH [unclassified Niallia]MDL0437767.1 two-component system activity regulator YycH [Niallia sp. SS-2023]UPO87660.1 two-component system activity regulator YycH [Niallia sp. Man26]